MYLQRYWFFFFFSQFCILQRCQQQHNTYFVFDWLLCTHTPDHVKTNMICSNLAFVMANVHYGDWKTFRQKVDWFQGTKIRKKNAQLKKIWMIIFTLSTRFKINKKKLYNIFLCFMPNLKLLSWVSRCFDM